MSTAQEFELQNEIENLEQLIAKSKLDIKRMEALARLEKNPDFKELIMEGFLEKHAIRQVMLKAAPDAQQPQIQELIDQQINAIGGFKQFLIGIFVQGKEAEKTLAEDENTLEEMNADLLKHGRE